MAYDADGGYNMDDQEYAMERKDDSLQRAADNAPSAYAIDWDPQSLKARTPRANGSPISMNEYISELEPDGPKWTEAFGFFRVKVHKMKAENDEDIHLLAVHGAGSMQGIRIKTQHRV